MGTREKVLPRIASVKCKPHGEKLLFELTDTQSKLFIEPALYILGPGAT